MEQVPLHTTAGEWDLGPYLRRIHYDGPREPSLDVLTAIVRLHPQHIPFENLSPLLGWPVRLDPASLQDKLIHQRRGGYCYEQNLLLQGMLESLGFEVRALAARVTYRSPPGHVSPRTHMLLRVVVDGTAWLVDVGFGGMAPNAPLRLDSTEPQSTPLEPYRLQRSGADYELQTLLPTGWTPLYVFDLQEQLLPDFELFSWYLCHHPESHFCANLYAARVVGSGRSTLLNDRLTRHQPGRESRQEAIENEAALIEVLDRVFGIEVPPDPQARRRLREIALA